MADKIKGKYMITSPEPISLKGTEKIVKQMQIEMNYNYS